MEIFPGQLWRRKVDGQIWLLCHAEQGIWFAAEMRLVPIGKDGWRLMGFSPHRRVDETELRQSFDLAGDIAGEAAKALPEHILTLCGIERE